MPDNFCEDLVPPRVYEHFGHGGHRLDREGECGQYRIANGPDPRLRPDSRFEVMQPANYYHTGESRARKYILPDYIVPRGKRRIAELFNIIGGMNPTAGTACPKPNAPRPPLFLAAYLI